MEPERHAAIADELFAAHRARSILPRLTVRDPGMTVDDSYAVQSMWAKRRIEAGHQVAGHKIGLTSKAMQAATGITEPDYGVIFDDQVFPSGCTVEFDAFSNVRIEVELAFALRKPLSGEGCSIDDVLDATDYVVPALEILNSHLELEGRTIVDTIADNAALGAMVVGDVHMSPAEVDLPWVAAGLGAAIMTVGALLVVVTAVVGSRRAHDPAVANLVQNGLGRSGIRGEIGLGVGHLRIPPGFARLRADMSILYTYR